MKFTKYNKYVPHHDKTNVMCLPMNFKYMKISFGKKMLLCFIMPGVVERGSNHFHFTKVRVSFLSEATVAPNKTTHLPLSWLII
jgi:hypothetical protein